ncbi:MAG: class I SAM-dependent methyltransferase [Ardenticatenaceae bacterium]
MSKQMAESAKSSKKDVYVGYERWSNTYDVQANPTRDLSSRVVRELVPELEGLIVVEAGCGTGLNSEWIAPRCKQLIGLDFSDGMLAIAKRKIKIKVPHVRFVKHDLQEKWPVDANSADLVLINLVLEHIEDIELVLRHAAFVMQKGAQLIITEYHPNRVLRGSGARIENDEQLVEITNFWHPIEQYVESAAKIGLQINSIDQWPEGFFDKESVNLDHARPLILSLCLEKM